MAQEPHTPGCDTKSLSIFAGCTRRALKRLSHLGTRVHMPAGKPLTKTGGSGAEVLIVLSGTAICQVHGIEVARFGPGDFFGEVATLDGGPRTATVVASTDMEVLVLSRLEFDAARQVLTRSRSSDPQDNGPSAPPCQCRRCRMSARRRAPSAEAR